MVIVVVRICRYYIVEVLVIFILVFLIILQIDVIILYLCQDFKINFLLKIFDWYKSYILYFRKLKIFLFVINSFDFMYFCIIVIIFVSFYVYLNY